MQPRVILPKKTVAGKKRVQETGVGSKKKKKKAVPQALIDEDSSGDESEYDQCTGVRTKIGSIRFKHNTDQEARYAALAKRQTTHSRFLCEDALEILGMKNDVYCLLHNASILKFATNPYPSYARLTLEVLSSCSLTLNPKFEINPDEDRWIFHFRALNKDYSLTMTELGEFIQLPADGADTVATAYDDASFWMNISMRDVLDDGTERPLSHNEKVYEPRKAKTSKIYSPVFRYVLKVISYGIFGRSDDAGVFSIMDNFVLNCITKGTPVNFAYLFANSLVKQGQLKKEGNIPVGGFITALCYNMGIRYQGLIEDRFYNLLDIKNAQESHWLQHKNGAYWYVYQKCLVFKFPYPSNFSFLDKENWKPVSAFNQPRVIQKGPSSSAVPSSASAPSSSAAPSFVGPSSSAVLPFPDPSYSYVPPDVHIPRPLRTQAEIRHEALMGKLDEIKQQGNRIEKNQGSFKKKMKKAISKIFAKLNITPPTSSDEEGNPRRKFTVAPEGTT